MFIIDPPYHNTKNKGSRDGMTGRKNGKRTIQTNAPLISPGLSEYYCSHALIWKKNKIQDFSLLYRNNRKGIHLHVLLYIHFT